jgi:hypothetical protein
VSRPIRDLTLGLTENDQSSRPKVGAIEPGADVQATDEVDTPVPGGAGQTAEEVVAARRPEDPLGDFRRQCLEPGVPALLVGVDPFQGFADADPGSGSYSSLDFTMSFETRRRTFSCGGLAKASLPTRPY